MSDDLLEKRLIFITGKGGVGKSTVAAALGIAAARQGKRTLLCEVASQERISRVFRKAEIGYREADLAEDLWGFSVDPDESMREYVLLQIKVKAMRDLLFRSRIFTYLAAATPGLGELVTIGKIWELAQLDRKVRSGRRYDLVIVDAPATGHGIGFLHTPKTFADIARVGPIKAQGEQLHRFITDPDLTAVALVSMPEEMPVNETVFLERDLADRIGIEVDRIYMNAVYPQRFSAGEAEALEEAVQDAEPEATAAMRAALTEHRRAKLHRSQLQRLKRQVSAPITTLPFVFERELEAPQLEPVVERVL